MDKEIRATCKTLCSVAESFPRGSTEREAIREARDGSRIRRWSNGIWSFHFVVESNGVAQMIDQQLKYWTFYYNPIIHGAPN